MQLKLMSFSEFILWKKKSIELYAQDKMQSHDLTKESATLLAENGFKRLLPKDLETEDAHLLSAIDNDGNLLGHIWFNITGEGTDKKAFIYDLIIEENYRSKGYGKKLMLLAEQEMKKLGVVRVGLHAFSNNVNAISLYQRLGFIQTDINMEKDLRNSSSSIIPTFETARIILKPVTENDFENYYKNINDYEVIRYLSSQVPWPYPKEGVGTFLNTHVFPFLGIDRWFWGIYLKENPSEVIGAIDLWRKPNPENRGFWLARNHWGKGIMSEATVPVTNYAFEKLGFEKLILSNAVGNIASRKIKEKAGAKFIGIRDAKFATNEFTQAETWELTKENWKKNNRPSFIGNYKDFKEEDNAHYPGSTELLTIGSPIGRILGLKKMGIHVETLPPGRRSSWPHAESEEEEFAYVIKGSPQVWINGNLHDLHDGDFVAFPAGTGITHTFINNTSEDVLLLVGGQSKIASNKVFYPKHPKRNQEMKDKGILWEDYPKHDYGLHNGLPNGVKDDFYKLNEQ